jgi:hypothetical protein
MWVGRTAENLATAVSGPVVGLAARPLLDYRPSHSPTLDLFFWLLIGYGILTLGIVIAFGLSRAILDPDGSDWSPRRTQDHVTTCIITLGVASAFLLLTR